MQEEDKIEQNSQFEKMGFCSNWVRSISHQIPILVNLAILGFQTASDLRSKISILLFYAYLCVDI